MFYYAFIFHHSMLDIVSQQIKRYREWEMYVWGAPLLYVFPFLQLIEWTIWMKFCSDLLSECLWHTLNYLQIRLDWSNLDHILYCPWSEKVLMKSVSTYKCVILCVVETKYQPKVQLLNSSGPFRNGEAINSIHFLPKSVTAICFPTPRDKNHVNMKQSKCFQEAGSR